VLFKVLDRIMARHAKPLVHPFTPIPAAVPSVVPAWYATGHLLEHQRDRGGIEDCGFGTRRTALGNQRLGALAAMAPMAAITAGCCIQAWYSPTSSTARIT
jgi:hypothetical protein